MTLSLNIPILTQLRLNLTASPGSISHSKSRLPELEMFTRVNMRKRLLQDFRNDHAAQPQLLLDGREIPIRMKHVYLNLAV